MAKFTDTVKKSFSDLQNNLTKSQQQISCEQAGGKWDGVRCIFPKEEAKQIQAAPPTAPPPEQKAKLTSPEYWTDAETGKINGIILPDGRNLLGIPQEDINMLANKYNQAATPPQGTNPVGTAQQAMADTQRKLQLAAQTGQIDMATAMQAEDLGINWREAILSGVSNVVPSAIGYGTVAAGGALAVNAAPGAGQIAYGTAIGAGAVAGALKGFYSGVTGNIKSQKGDLISGKVTELSRRRTALNNYISAANANPASAEEMLQAYITEKSLIRKDYNTLLREANEDLTYWGGQDGTKQIIDYEVYFESVEPSLDAKMQQAILKPDPTRAYLSVEGTE